MATTDGTRAYRTRHGDRFGRTYFRRFDDLSLSSIGVGTYLGDPTDAVDADYREAIVAALEGGCNVVDTAINYRHQRSERVVGEAIEQANVDREEVFVATKGGFVPFDGERPANPGAYVREEFVASGLLDPGDLGGVPGAGRPRQLPLALGGRLAGAARGQGVRQRRDGLPGDPAAVQRLHGRRVHRRGPRAGRRPRERAFVRLRRWLERVHERLLRPGRPCGRDARGGRRAVGGAIRLPSARSTSRGAGRE